jgi:hypothetical protein
LSAAPPDADAPAPTTASPDAPPAEVPPAKAPPAKASLGPAASARWLSRLLRGWRGAAVVYLVFVAAYLGASGGRLRMHSQYNHYVYLADGWLHGRLTLAGPPPNENDWAKIDVLKLKDGRELRGIYGGRVGGGASDRFYPMRGDSFILPAAQIASRSTIRLVSFPPFPAVAMLPFVAIWGLQYNDVLFTALWAAANPTLLFLLLRALRARGYSRRSEVDDLWLTAMFGVGSVYYFCSVVGEVWFTAEIIGVTLSIGYLWGSLDARRPVLAGACVALGFATRPPWAVLPLFLFEAVRAVGGREALRDPKARRALVVSLIRFAAPIAIGGLVLAAYNYARFKSPFEFGHKYMPVQWQDRMFRFGLFNYHFLSRNLAAALVLLPRIMDHYPYVKVSQHGMSLLVTSPNLAYTVLPQEKSPLTKALWLTILTTALPDLLYQNSGYVQWGFRFSLDFMIYFMVLLAIGNRPLTRRFRALVVVAVAINLFLAIGFDRYTQFSYDDTFFPHGNN